MWCRQPPVELGRWGCAARCRLSGPLYACHTRVYGLPSPNLRHNHAATKITIKQTITGRCIGGKQRSSTNRRRQRAMVGGGAWRSRQRRQVESPTPG